MSKGKVIENSLVRYSEVMRELHFEVEKAVNKALANLEKENDQIRFESEEYKFLESVFNDNGIPTHHKNGEKLSHVGRFRQYQKLAKDQILLSLLGNKLKKIEELANNLDVLAGPESEDENLYAECASKIREALRG